MSASDSLRHGIAHRLRMAREMAGLSQGQVAKELGWHRPTVSEIEAGRRRVSAENCQLFLRFTALTHPGYSASSHRTLQRTRQC